MSGRLRFDHLMWSNLYLEWIMFTDDEGDEGVAPVASLVGRTVNIGTKDGEVYEGVLVSGFDKMRGFLEVEGGRKGITEENAAPLAATESLRVHDVARGYVHQGEPS